MLRPFVRSLALLPVALSLAACVSFRLPATGADSLEAQRKEVPPPSGYLALTAGFDLNSLATYQPHVMLDVKNTATGETQELRVTEKEFAAFGKVEQVPLVFVLPAGDYELVGSRMHIPGGFVNGREYEGVDQNLGLEKQVQPFKVSADAVTHLAEVKLAMKDVLKGTTRFYYCETTVRLDKPAEPVWKPYAGLLAKAPASYLKKTQMNSYAWPKLAWGSTQRSLDKQQVQKVTGPAMKTAQSCHGKLAPRSRGKVSLEYVIAPEGTVHQAQVTKSTLGHPATESCIVEAFRKLQFPRPPGDDYETWTASIEF